MIHETATATKIKLCLFCQPYKKNMEHLIPQLQFRNLRPLSSTEM